MGKRENDMFGESWVSFIVIIHKPRDARQGRGRGQTVQADVSQLVCMDETNGPHPGVVLKSNKLRPLTTMAVYIHAG